MTHPREELRPEGNHGKAWFYKHCRKGLWGACDECKAARNAYVRERRAKRPEVRAAESKANSARTRALWRRARNHPDEVRELCEAELGREEAA